MTARGKPLPYLAAWREQRLMSSSELARRSGMARSAISRAEKGDTIVSWASIHKLAGVLGIRPEQLIRKPEEGE